MTLTMTMDKEEIIAALFEKGVLVNKEIISGGLDETILQKIESEADMLVLTSDYVSVINQQSRLVDWYDIDKYRVDAEKDRNEELYRCELQEIKTTSLHIVTRPGPDQSFSSLEVAVDKGLIGSFATEGKKEEEQPLPPILDDRLMAPSVVTIIVSYVNLPRKYVVEDFSNFFISRYRFLENLLCRRQELVNLLSIGRALSKNEKGPISIIGLVESIGETKAGNIIVTLEDLTGKIKVLFSKSKKELFSMARDLVVDEVVGIYGQCSEKFVFAENIIWPDIPQTSDIKKSESEEYLIFLSDIHVGSSLFLKEEFDKFLHWIRGEYGTAAQKEIADKVKYIFIGGDVVDGVGVYPSQEEELEIKDIKKQYEEFSRLLGLIPPNKKLIICPGNHDAVHLAEPQPAFYQEFAPGLFNLPNVTLVTNPSLINIGKTAAFPGFDVLLYHGYSFDYYVANVESIRTGGGYHRSDLIMKFLLKRRHLAPSFTSTPYHPSQKEDPLLIRTVPDFFLTGHIHYSSVANYRGVTMVSGSCWQGKTSFQEKLGHEPEPARVPLINLKTREIKVLRFG